jgi:CHAT domain-containing protein/tetratricopeptide (TPR) repeat protein
VFTFAPWRERSRRLRRCRAASVAVLALCCGWAGLVSASHAPSNQPARDLELGRKLEGELASGQVHTFRLPLTQNEFIRLVVEQRGVDVSVALLRPDGSPIWSQDAASDEFQAETLVAISDVTGLGTVVVKPSNPGRPPGRYVIDLEAARPAVERDQTALGAERAFDRAHGIEIKGVFSDYPQALAELQTAGEAFQALGDQAGELKTTLERAFVEWSLSRPEAMASAQRAEQLAAALHDEPSRAEAIHYRGSVQLRIGDLASALRAFEDALAIYQALGHQQGEARMFNETGLIYGRTGDSDRALVYFERALAIQRARKDHTFLVVLNNVGIAYKNVGDYDRALDAYQEALTFPDMALDRNLHATLLNNAGNLQHLLGHDREALGLHLQALGLARQIGSAEVEARSLNTIGQTYFSLGEYNTALTYQQESLALRRSLRDLPGQAASLTAMGRTLARLGEADRAYASLLEGLALLRSIREQYSEPDTLRSLATIDRDRGNVPLALDRIKAAVDLDEQLRERITSPELRATFVASELDKYELYIDLLEQESAADPTGGHAAEAFDVSERARARVLLESLLDARVDLRQGVDPVVLDRERSLQKQLATVSGQISRALAAPGATGPPAGLVQSFERLTGEYQQHLALMRRQSARYADMTHPQPLEAAQIQRAVIDDGTVLLEFELGEAKSWLWALTPTTLTSVELPPRREIDAAARQLYENLTARQRHAGEASAAYAQRVGAADAALDGRAAAVSRLLFQGVAARLETEWRGKRLAIVAAGSLEYVPFAALPSPTGGRTLIASRHEIIKIPSASVLAVLRSESAQRPPAAYTLAIVADPVFEATDPRVTAASRPTPDATPRAGDLAEGPAGTNDAADRRGGLARLPFSRDEANAIAALVGGKGVFEAVDFDATRAAALGGALAGARIVHLATHGILDSARPSLSGLVFSLVNQHGQRQDGFVRLPDIYNMRLDADLVVLSACQTALGKDIKGEGLIGLTRAFMYAGTPRVVASLWEVSDLATAELMKKFYAGMLRQHLPAAAALRDAQLQMAQDPRWASPYYWAGFVFQGDWR